MNSLGAGGYGITVFSNTVLVTGEGVAYSWNEEHSGMIHPGAGDYILMERIDTVDVVHEYDVTDINYISICSATYNNDGSACTWVLE